MAEVRKKVIEDKYNTKSIEKSLQKEEKKKKVKKTNNKKEVKKEKKNLFEKFMVFCHGVKSEFKKVHWTNKKDMIKYSISTVIFIVFCSLFFYLVDFIFALVQSLFN